jgi:tetratricopeptide (TPR) repeat protein
MKRSAAIALALIALPVQAFAAEHRDGGARPGRALFEQAEAKFNVGRFDEALVDYQAAYDAEPLPAFLFNIGQCHRNLGNYEQAQFFFRRYTALDPRSPNRPAAERLIVEMDRLAGERATAAEPDRAAPALALAAPGPASADRQPRVDQPASVANERRAEAGARPLARRPWFWVALSAVVVGGVAAAYALRPDDPRSSLRPIDAR